LYKYNQLDKCIEEVKYGNNSYKNITAYNKDGLKEKLELYQDEKSRGRTMDKPWRTYLYFYNDKNQLIKEEARHPEPKKDLATYYSYYENGLLKEKREEITSTYIFTNEYEYWD
jgi:hypothetical protein